AVFVQMATTAIVGEPGEQRYIIGNRRLESGVRFGAGKPSCARPGIQRGPTRIGDPLPHGSDGTFKVVDGKAGTDLLLGLHERKAVRVERVQPLVVGEAKNRLTDEGGESDPEIAANFDVLRVDYRRQGPR